jgi:hypothetical protein
MRLIDAERLGETIENSYTPAMATAIRRYIICQPTVDAAPVVHGQWILDEDLRYTDDKRTYRVFHCSVCEFHIKAINLLPDYCPLCGAIMEVKRDDT